MRKVLFVHIDASANAGVLKLRYKSSRGSGVIKPSLITFGLGIHVISYLPDMLLFFIKTLPCFALVTPRKLLNHGTVVRCVIASDMTDLQKTISNDLKAR